MTEPDDQREALTPQERWNRTPRPLQFVRPRLTVDIARYLSYLLKDEQEVEFEELTKLREAKTAEDSDEVTTTIGNLRAIISAQKEISKALIELVGPESGG